MKILVIDIETTGFSHSNDFILEIGAVELNLQTKEIKVVFDERIIEEGLTDEKLEKSWIWENSDISSTFKESAITLEDARIVFQSILDKYPLGFTAFNKKFDEGFLEDRNFKLPKSLDCPMLLSTDVVKIKGKYGKYKWPKVQEAYDFFFPRNDYIEKHRGADDAYNEAKIVHKLYELGLFEV